MTEVTDLMYDKDICTSFSLAMFHNIWKRKPMTSWNQNFTIRIMTTHIFIPKSTNHYGKYSKNKKVAITDFENASIEREITYPFNYFIIC